MGIDVGEVFLTGSPNEDAKTFMERNRDRKTLKNLNVEVVELTEASAIAHSELIDQNTMRENAFEGVVMTALIDISSFAAVSTVIGAHRKVYVDSYSVSSQRVPLGTKMRCVTHVSEVDENRFTAMSEIQTQDGGNWKTCSTAQTHFITKPR